MTQADTHHQGTHRHHRGRWALGVAVGIVLALIIGWGFLYWAAEPPQPGGFYTPPDPLPDGEPGTILDTDRLDGVPDGATGTRVLYLSTDPEGEPVAVSGVVIAPEGDPPPGGRPVLAWSHPTTGIARRCAPSIGNGVSATIPGLERFLDAGYVVAATDYPGLGTRGPHPYLIGESEARAAIDSVRAARQLHDGVSERFASWGHSQGGQSSLFVGEIVEDYAPEVELVGVAAAAPASELRQLLELDLPSLAGKVLTSMALASWARIYPDASLERAIQPQSIEAVEAVANDCIGTDPEKVVLGLDAVFLQEAGFLRLDPGTAQPWAKIMQDNSATAERATAPLFIGQGTADVVVHPQVTEAFVESACDAGIAVELKLLEGVDHGEAGFASADAAADWIAARFAGEPAPSTCDDGARR